MRKWSTEYYKTTKYEPQTLEVTGGSAHEGELALQQFGGGGVSRGNCAEPTESLRNAIALIFLLNES